MRKTRVATPVMEPFVHTMKRLVPACIVALGVCACEDPKRPPLGFDAKLVLPIQDQNVSLEGFDKPRNSLFYKIVTDASDSVYDLHSLNLETQKTEFIISRVRWFAQGPSDEEHLRYFVSRAAEPGGVPGGVYTALDRKTGDQSDVDGVVDWSASILGWDSVIFVRQPDSEHGELWTGPLLSPQRVAEKLDVHDWTWLGPNKIALTARELSSDKSEGIAIYSFDLGNKSVEKVVPAKIESAAWLGPDPVPADLSSEGIYKGDAVGERKVAKIYGNCFSPTQDEAWVAPDQRCYLLYERETAGVKRTFMYDAVTKKESVLPVSSPTSVRYPGNGGHSVFGNAPLMAWHAVGEGGTASSQIVLVDWRTGEKKTCDLGKEAPLTGCDFRGDRRTALCETANKYVFIDWQEGSCSFGDAPKALQTKAWPEDGKVLYVTKSEIWLANDRARDARLLFSGPRLALDKFIKDHRILAYRQAVDGWGLIWLDLDEESPQEHVLVDQSFGLDAELYDGKRVIKGGEYNAQNGTGRLSIIDIDPYKYEPIADMVASYRFGEMGKDDDSLPVAMLRAARFGANDTDGIWVAKIPKDRLVDPVPDAEVSQEGLRARTGSGHPVMVPSSGIRRTIPIR